MDDVKAAEEAYWDAEGTLSRLTQQRDRKIRERVAEFSDAVRLEVNAEFSAMLDDADYSHMSCNVSMNKEVKKEMESDPDAFTRLLMHELLHFLT